MKQRVIGTYVIGFEQVKLVLTDDDGGAFYLIPSDGGVPIMNVGADFESWHKVVEVLLHETAEFAMMRQGARFSPSPDHAADHGGYFFVMDHQKFSQVMAMVAEFAAAALPDLAEAWNKRKGNK